MKSNASKIELRMYDDLFETDESRAERDLPKIRDIPLNEIDDFPDHPFKVREGDDDMIQLIESIKTRGIITPVTLREKEDGRYEIISGHRRKKACELAGINTLKAEVKNLSRDEAIILMVDSNLQRSTILPSERAFSYKMRLEAIKRQGERTDLTSCPLGEKLLSVETLSQSVPESERQIHRYIRLTALIPEIMEMVDDKRIAFRPAVELSYLTDQEQYDLLETMELEDATPSLAQAIKMKNFSKEQRLNADVILSIMSEEKPNQRVKPIFEERITKLIPKSFQKGRETDFVVKALEHYNKFLQRKKEQER